MTTHNIVSVSGGKDSTATLLVAIALETPNLQPCLPIPEMNTTRPTST